MSTLQGRMITTVGLSTVLFLAFPGSALAQGRGCPWCTTPTTCGQVEENTPLSSCWVTQADGCRESEGSCIHQVALEPDNRAETLLPNGLEYRGAAYVEFQGVPVELIGVGDDLFLKWNCAGAVALAFRRTADGDAWEKIDVASLGEEYALKAPTPAILSVASEPISGR